MKRYNAQKLEMNLDIDKGEISIESLVEKYSFFYLRKFLDELMSIKELEIPYYFNNSKINKKRKDRYVELRVLYPTECYPEIWL